MIKFIAQEYANRSTPDNTQVIVSGKASQRHPKKHDVLLPLSKALVDRLFRSHRAISVVGDHSAGGMAKYKDGAAVAYGEHNSPGEDSQTLGT